MNRPVMILKKNGEVVGKSSYLHIMFKEANEKGINIPVNVAYHLSCNKTSVACINGDRWELLKESE